MQQWRIIRAYEVFREGAENSARGPSFAEAMAGRGRAPLPVSEFGFKPAFPAAATVRPGWSGDGAGSRG
jgi:hypothetical protein